MVHLEVLEPLVFKEPKEQQVIQATVVKLVLEVQKELEEISERKGEMDLLE